MHYYLHEKEQEDLLKIFLSQRVPKIAALSILRVLQHWERHHGISWVVSRLKSMRASLLSGDEIAGIGYHPDGTFKGPFRYLSRLAARSRKGSIVADRLIRIYGRWEAGGITAADYDKFTRTVEVPDDSSKDVPIKVPSWLKRISRNIGESSSFDHQLPVSKEKKVPFLGKSEYDTSVTEHYAIFSELCPNLIRLNRSFLEENVFETNIFLEDLFSFGCHFDEETPRSQQLCYDVAGKIGGLTKDRGLKKRFIANPHRLLQVGLSRLKRAANRTLQQIEASLVHNQEASEAFIVDKFSEGKVAYSLDLTSATDHFPFWYQKRVAEILFPSLRQDIQLWSDATLCSWEIPLLTEEDRVILETGPKPRSAAFIKPDTSKYVRYTKGQPMGTNPSFAIFTLSHIVLLYSLGGTHSNFRVIGDDVVIFDAELASRYQREIGRLGVQISLTKSLIGKYRAEFAGRIADRRGFWPSYKSSPINPYKDPMGAFRQFGLRGSVLLPKKYRAVLEFFAQLPLIGPKHCWNKEVLNDLTPEQVLTLYRPSPGRAFTFSSPRLVDVLNGYQGQVTPGVIVTRRNRNLEIFEATLPKLGGGYVTVRDDSYESSRTLVEHMNLLNIAVSQWSVKSDFLDQLAKLVPKGGVSTDPSGPEPKQPLSLYRS